MTSYMEALQAVAKGAGTRAQVGRAVPVARRMQKKTARTSPVPTPGPGPSPQEGPKDPLDEAIDRLIGGGGEETLPVPGPAQGSAWDVLGTVKERVGLPEYKPLPISSREVFSQALGGAYDLPTTIQALVAQGFTPGQVLALLGGGGGGGGGDPGYLALQREQFEYGKQQDALANMVNLIQMASERDQLQRVQQQNQAQLMAELAPMSPAGRTHFGGFEPYGAYSAVANYAGVPYQPRPIQTVNIPTGVPPPDPVTDALIAQYRAALGV